MPQFDISVPEVFITVYRVEAPTIEEALLKLQADASAGREIAHEYDETIEPDVRPWEAQPASEIESLAGDADFNTHRLIGTSVIPVPSKDFHATV